MLLPQLPSALIRVAVALGLLGASNTAALAQTAPQHLVLRATKTYHPQKSATAQTDALLAALSAEAGVPFFATPQAASRHPVTVTQSQTSVDPALCLRAGVGISAAVMSGSQVNVEHGIIGCHTETAGLPISVSPDPALQPPPTSRTGEYTVDLTLRYRLLQRKRVQVEASLTDQGLAYSIDRPISGNNLVAAMSVKF